MSDPIVMTITDMTADMIIHNLNFNEPPLTDGREFGRTCGDAPKWWGISVTVNAGASTLSIPHIYGSEVLWWIGMKRDRATLPKVERSWSRLYSELLADMAWENARA